MKNLAYGARIPDAAALDKAFAIMRDMHRLRNVLVEVELERRRAYREMLRKVSPQLAALDEREEELAQQADELFAQAKKARVAAQGTSSDVAYADQIKACKRDLREVRKQAKDLSQSLRDKIDKPLRVLHAEHKQRMKATYHAARECLSSECVSSVMADMQGAASGTPPRFRRWDGEGAVCTCSRNGGFPIAREESGAYVFGNYLQIDAAVCDQIYRNPKAISGKTPWLNARIRIGADGRDPIWLPFAVKMHRPLPEGGKVKWAKLLARRIGAQTKWQLVVTCDAESWPSDAADEGAGTVAVDIGWHGGDDGVAVARWLGSDCRSGTLVLDNDMISHQRKTLDLQSIRDKAFDSIRDQLTAYLHRASHPWLQEECTYLARWRSQAKLASLVLRWRDNRKKGDEPIYAACEEWRKRDKHLWTWQSHERQRRVLNRRKDLFRKFAHTLASEYDTVVIRKVDRKALAARPVGEEGGKTHAQKQSEYRRISCGSSLVQCLKEKARTFVELPKVKGESLVTCSECGHQRPPACVPCPTCGTDWRDHLCLMLLDEHLSPRQMAQVRKARAIQNTIQLKKGSIK